MGLIRPFAKREREILGLLCEGKTSKEIASALNLAPRTIDRRLEGMCCKAGVGRRSELMIWAVRSEARAA